MVQVAAGVGAHQSDPVSDCDRILLMKICTLSHAGNDHTVACL